MSKITEKAIKGLHQFIDAHGGADSEEELQELLDQYMLEYNSSLGFQEPLSQATAKTSDDWLELAEGSEDVEEGIRCAKKALELDPHNYDAALFILTAENELPHIHLERLNALVEQGTEHMKETNNIPDEVGHFWGILETRPYMRLLQARMMAETEFGMFLAAIADGEEIIRLNNNDNMGVRSALMSLYAMVLKETEAEALLERYYRDGYVETSLYLPLSILYFRLGKLEKAKEILLKLADKNHDTKKFFRAALNGELDQYLEKMSPMGYRPNTMDEYLVFIQNEYLLFTQSGAYLMWAETVLKQKSGPKPAIRKKKKRH